MQTRNKNNKPILPTRNPKVFFMGTPPFVYEHDKEQNSFTSYVFHRKRANPLRIVCCFYEKRVNCKSTRKTAKVD